MMEILSTTTDARLLERLHELREIYQPWQNADRRLQISKEMYRIVFEQKMRYVETHPNNDLEEKYYELEA